MTLTYDRLIDNAMTDLDLAGGDVDSDFSGRLTQQSIGYSLIAIAQELHRMNDNQELYFGKFGTPSDKTKPTVYDELEDFSW